MKRLSLLFIFMSIVALGFTQNNRAAGAVNFYKDLYGTTIASSSRGAMDALVFIDGTFNNANDYVVPALVNQGYNVTVAASWSDFDTKLATGNYGFAVAYIQGISLHPSLSVLQNYVNNGGKMLYCDWVYSPELGHGNFESYYNLFNATTTGNIDYSSCMISDPVVFNGVTNPVMLTTPYYIVSNYGLDVFGAGEVLGTFPQPSRTDDASMILGNGGNTIILGYLSDTPPESDRQQLVENLIMKINGGGPTPPVVPVSNWALIFGIFLISIFMVVRYRRNLA